MSLSRWEFSLKVYTLLTFLSKLGGLFSAMMSFCFLCVNVLNFHGSFQFVMHDLFFVNEDDKKQPEAPKRRFWQRRQRVIDENDVQWRCCKSLYLVMLNKLPQSCRKRCLKPSRLQKLRARGLQ